MKWFSAEWPRDRDRREGIKRQNQQDLVTNSMEHGGREVLE